MNNESKFDQANLHTLPRKAKTMVLSFRLHAVSHLAALPYT